VPLSSTPDEKPVSGSRKKESPSGGVSNYEPGQARSQSVAKQEPWEKKKTRKKKKERCNGFAQKVSFRVGQRLVKKKSGEKKRVPEELLLLNSRRKRDNGSIEAIGLIGNLEYKAGWLRQEKTMIPDEYEKF